jgi:hypothetical protein
MKRPAWRRSVRTGCVAVVALALAGCDGLFSPSDRQPREARVVVSGTSVTALRLITSTNFTAEQDPGTGVYHVNFVTSDVLERPLPLERTVRLGTDRFMARVVNPSTEHTAIIVMQVYFDGNLVYRQEAALRDAHLDFIQVFF